MKIVKSLLALMVLSLAGMGCHRTIEGRRLPHCKKYLPITALKDKTLALYNIKAVKQFKKSVVASGCRMVKGMPCLNWTGRKRTLLSHKYHYDPCVPNKTCPWKSPTYSVTLPGEGYVGIELYKNLGKPYGKCDYGGLLLAKRCAGKKIKLTLIPPTPHGEVRTLCRRVPSMRGGLWLGPLPAGRWMLDPQGASLVAVWFIPKP